MKTGKDTLLDRQQAAEYCYLPDDKFKNQMKSGCGPRYIKISAHVILFRKEDLDQWMASWHVVEPTKVTA
jgi:predicted DNA-binding transcriptional regulator AlpA